MKSEDAVIERIGECRQDVISIQAGLTSRPALGPDNGGTGEHDKTLYMKGLLESLRPDRLVEIDAPDDRARDGYRPNLLATWGDTSARPTVWVLSHSDIVPPGDLSLWDGDPFRIRVEGDRISGRGVEDNQHGFVSSYLALKTTMECLGRPAGPVGLAVVADEETGSKYGLQYVLAHHAEMFKKEDLIIVPDGGNEEGTMIEVAEKSMLWMRFTVTGKQCHASTPEKGRNSLYGAARLIVALERLKGVFSDTDGLFRPPSSTFEPTRIEGNVPNINTIPGRDVFYVDCRVLPRYSADRVLDAARETARILEGETGVQVEVEAVYRQDATEPTSPDAPVVTSLTGAIRRVTGKTAAPMGIGGGTVAAFFRRAGLPAAVWSTVSDTAHQLNEYALISNILTDAKIFACLYGMNKEL
jgi:succinyl-diaminopimelate desuccinylase